MAETTPARHLSLADLSNDPAVLERCAAVLDDLLQHLPSSAADRPDVRMTILRIARLRSPWYRSRTTRRLALSWWLFRDRTNGREARTLRKKHPETVGRGLGFEHAVIWDD